MLKEIRESQSGLEQSAVFERIQELREIQRGLEESTVLKAITASAVLKAIEESQIWKESAVLKAITASAMQAITESAVAGGMQKNLIDSSSR